MAGAQGTGFGAKAEAEARAVAGGSVAKGALAVFAEGDKGRFVVGEPGMIGVADELQIGGAVVGDHPVAVVDVVAGRDGFT